MQHFIWGHTIMVISVIGSFFYGGISALQTVVLLIALEVSMSFDNSVINVKILKHMSKAWQKAFLTWGILIAVFGMRFAFPIVIVSIAGGMTMFESLNTALDNPELYRTILNENQSVIFALGGSFLFMIFINWFLGEKEDFWFKALEDNKLMRSCNELETLPLAIAIGLGLTLATLTEDFRVVMYYFSGILMYEILQIVDKVLSPEDENGNVAVKSGIAGFLYLELLDASFSFDGVIGAFALTDDIFLIMIGLGVGAIYVREMTIYFLHKGTIDEYKYLDHGAHYAIGILSIMMFIKMFTHVNELIVGSIGILLIGAAFLHSYYEKNEILDK